MYKIKHWPLFILGTFCVNSYADMEYHRNTLLGGRAATMGGAYTAISDDASGAFYNPAGLSWATSNSFSGSANTYSMSDTSYKNTIENRNWDREASNLKPNFFGVVQKNGDDTFAFSYALTDSFVEHQDQIYKNLTDTVDPIDLYVLNLHSEDNTYLVGPSYSKQINPDLSIGVSAFYHYRVFRRAQSQLLRYNSGDDEASYLNNTKKEKGFKTKLGVMYSPAKKWSLGASIAKTVLITSMADTQQNQKLKGVATYQFSQIKTTDKRKTPIELETGVAYFASSYLLFSANLDYFRFDGDTSREDVINLSLGSEYYLAEKHAIRAGFYTNNTNSVKPTKSTTAPIEHMDMYGLTAGYTLYSQSTSITFGTIYSWGQGLAQIYTDSTATRDFSKRSLDFIVAADYGF
jgi:hypothetical protein